MAARVTTVSEKVCVAAGALPLEACTVMFGNEPEPAEVAVPESTPAEESERPGGREPPVITKVGAGVPVVVNVNE